MAVREEVQSDAFVYPERPDSLGINVAENTVVEVRPRQEGINRQEGPYTGLKLFIILILGFFVFSFMFGSRKALFFHSIKDIFVYRERSSIFVESDVRLYRFQRLLSVFGFLSCLLLFSLLLQQGQHATLALLDKKTVLAALVVLSVYVLIKSLFYRLFTLFQFDASTARQWQNDNLLLFIVLSLLFAILVFANEMMFIRLEHLMLVGLILWISDKSILFAKTIHYFSKQRLSGFHLILYLCALEILPVCVLYKGIIWIRQII